MYRVNHIMRTINEMSSYTPHMKVNRISERLSKLQKLSFCVSIISFFLLSIIALTYGPFDTKNNLSFISVLSPVSYKHFQAHETSLQIVSRLLLDIKNRSKTA